MSEPKPPEEKGLSRRIFLVSFLIALLIGSVGIFSEIQFRNNTTICRRTTQLAIATSIEQAVNQFYIEYGKLPDVGNRVTTHSPEGLKLLNILLGLDAKSDDALNYRAIKFLAVKEGKNHKNGLIYSADRKSVEGLYDPWGSSYTVILDTESKEHLHFTIGSKTIDLKGRRSAAFSPGPDKQVGTSDDVRTW